MISRYIKYFSRILSISQIHKGGGRFSTINLVIPANRMVGVCMGNYGLVYRLFWIEVKIAVLAVNAGCIYGKKVVFDIH